MVDFLRKDRHEGSITIEAALMLPLIMMVCLTLLMMSLYYHDLLVGDAAARYVKDSPVLGEAADGEIGPLLLLKPEMYVSDSEGLLWQKRQVRFDSRKEAGIPGGPMGISWSEQHQQIPPKSFIRLVDFVEDSASVFGLPKVQVRYN